MNSYEVHKDYVKVIVSNTKNEGYFLIDLEDLERVKTRQWSIKDSTNTNPHGYVAAKINNKTIKLHRFIMNVSDRKQIVDHINRDVWDNRKSNLRVTDSSSNNLNTSFSKNNMSGRTGVYYKKGTKGDSWTAQVQNNGKKITKGFAILKYGYEEAYKLAVKQREKWEEEFNINTERERSETIETTSDEGGRE